MGLFDFGKKKDPLDELALPSNAPPTEFDAKGVHDQEQPAFQHEDLPTSDPMSQTPQFSQPEAPVDNLSSSPSNTSGDLYSNYQQAVNSSPGTFHSSEQNVEPSKNSANGADHSTELLLSKLDVLKAMIENLGHRIENLEQKYDRDKEERKKSW